MLFTYFVLSLVAVALAYWLINIRFQVAENGRTILNVVLALIVVGMFLWVVNTYVPMAQAIKAILNVVVVVATCVKVLQALGLWGEVEKLWNKIKSHRFTHEEHPEGSAPKA
jgi:predicted membrane protein